ncbi:proteolipid protein 2-like [Anneissia japonica]|uniref:proteolipid protein 2-like n=1 Tax=Anneissia japonica TaxID=1529436 RepID=UPI001425AAAE|nr:proteolipid protein 2-like [Anneissia japonica]
MDDDFPDKIQTTTTTTAHHTTNQGGSGGGGGGGGITVDKAYLRSLPAILHIVQIVLSFLYWVILCAVVYFNVGFMITVGLTAMIETAIYFVVFLLHLNEKVQFIAWELSEFILNCVVTGLYLVSAIITSVKAGQSKYYSDHGKLVFCTLLAWALTLLYAASIFFSFRAFMAHRDRRSAGRPATLTTTTTTTQQTTTVVTDGSQVFVPAQDPYAPPAYSPY